MRTLALAGALMVAAAAAGAQAGQGRDTMPTPLDPVIVTAERTSLLSSAVAAAVTRISGAEIARTPRATIADLLRLAPGPTVISFDGLGYDPQVMMRGFYGGGEAEYVVVLVNGRPVSQLHTGLVAWDALPAAASIEAIEIVRGGASAQYGDAAFAGVINVITARPTSRNPVRIDASRMSYNGWSYEVEAPDDQRGRPMGLSFGAVRTGGYRDHAARTTSRGRMLLGLLQRQTSHISLDIAAQRRTFDEPGALLDSLATENRRGSDPLFRFDRTRDENLTIGLNADRLAGRTGRAVASVVSEWRSIDAFRTLALAPGFGDTKERESGTFRTASTLQFEYDDSPLPGADHLLLGGEFARGSLSSTYYRVLTGTRDDYLTSTGARDALDTEWDGSRSTLAFFGQYSVAPMARVRLSLGARYDRLRDEFTPATPAGMTGARATHTAFSPKLGLNLRYARDASGIGNVYVSAGRSFKAPTLDQLYDLRNIPIPTPPFEVRTSNPDLEPQRATNYEAGIRHASPLGRALAGAASLSAYQMDVKNELDFDVTSFRYVNIGRSRHRGIEAGGRLVGANGHAMFANYTLQSVVARHGEFTGNQLKAIPKHTFTTGMTVGGVTDALNLIYTYATGAYIDDANTRTLSPIATLDLQLSSAWRGTALYLNIRNVLDRRYNSSAFLDPAGTGAAYVYPAAGRVYEFGARSGW